MDSNLPYWHKQTPEQPLFPDMQWSRPENRMHAGKLLIIGGNLHGFAAPAEAYGESLEAGVGASRVMLPDKLMRTVGKVFPEAEYAPSTQIGSFAQNALGEFMTAAEWADGILLAGDFGKNSETAIVIESFLQKYDGSMTLCCDAVDQLIANVELLFTRPDTTLVLDFSQLQKLAIQAKFSRAFTSDMDFVHFLEALHEFSRDTIAHLVVQRDSQWFVAVDGKVSSTLQDWSSTTTAAHASVWLLQNPNKPFEALTTSLVA